jgi:hypothetical protein
VLTIDDRLAERAIVKLTPDLSGLSASEREMLPLLVDAAEQMDDLYWLTSVGRTKGEVLGEVADPTLRRLVEMNTGPWDRLHDWRPLLAGAPTRPAGAAFYPADMTEAEFEAAAAKPGGEALRDTYTLVRRDGDGELVAVPYHVAFAPIVARAAASLRRAAALAEDDGLRRYLELRAIALETDDYLESDRAWLDMRSNTLELVIGPIETYDDLLFGYKAAYEAIVLVKDSRWSEQLARYAAFLPALQEALPVPEAYRRERPGVDGDLQVYDTVYLSGDAAAFPAIGINLPDDERVKAEKGTRRLQLRSLMQAKFDAISARIADVLIAVEQRPNVTFEAMFQGIMFHEVAHGLGVSYTIDGSGTVAHALKASNHAIEEEKSDVLGQFMLDRLDGDASLSLSPRLDRYVSYVNERFRHLRSGGTSPYTAAAASQLTRYVEEGALIRDPSTGRYRVEPERMRASIESLARDILMLQGDGDEARARDWVAASTLGGDLAVDVQRIDDAGVPVDVFFENPPAFREP